MSVHSVSKFALLANVFSKILIASFFAAGIIPGNSDAAENTADPISEKVRTVFDRCRNAVVKIEAVDQCNLIGTGFFIDPSGTIYTSYSIGGESHDIVVSYGGKKYPATRLLGEPRSGIAILKIEASTPFLPVSRTEEPMVAMPVLAIGYPMDLPLTPSLGIVAGLDSKNAEGYFLTVHIRANVPVQRGQGGAPLLNLKGEVVGIVISGLDYGVGCYALPIAAAEKVRMNYVRFGDVRPGWIGINVVQSPTETGGSTVVVNDLLRNTPAAKSGLKKGDFLLRVGDRKIATPEDVLNASFFLTAGDEVPITVLRGDKKITVKAQAVDPNVSIATSPSAPGGIPLSLPR